MSIAEKIEKFQEIKERIRKTIISKGVGVPEGASLSEMADQRDAGPVYLSNLKEKKND